MSRGQDFLKKKPLSRPLPEFDGSDYEHRYDHARLSGQILRLFELMNDGQWRTLKEISALTEIPEASASAHLRSLRKERFGAYTVNRRIRGIREQGLWEYQVVVPKPVPEQMSLTL